MKKNNFQDIIKAHLDERATNDELFAVNYAKEAKSIEECCSYIQGRVKKQAQNGFAAVEREEVFGWAVHYYDEDDIKVKKASPARIAVSKTAPSPRKALVKTVKKEQSVEQLSLFA